jgi:hypothetical protein
MASIQTRNPSHALALAPEHEISSVPPDSLFSLLKTKEPQTMCVSMVSSLTTGR